MGKRKRPRIHKGPRDNVLYKALSEELITEHKDIVTHNVLRGGVRRKLEEYVKLRPTPVYWGIPGDEVLFFLFFTRFINLGIMPWDSFGTTEATYLPSARNDIHNGFLETNVEYLMMIDSDILAPPELVNTLLDHNKPIVGGWYKNKRRLMPPDPIVYDYHNTNEEGHINWMQRKSPGKGLEKVDGAGAGCWLMSREVAEALGENPYNLSGGTEDLVVSKKIMDLGFDMYVDWGLECAHLGISYI